MVRLENKTVSGATHSKSRPTLHCRKLLPDKFNVIILQLSPIYSDSFMMKLKPFSVTNVSTL